MQVPTYMLNADVQVRTDERAAPGCLHVDMPLQHSLHLCPGESYDFRYLSIIAPQFAECRT